MISVKDSNKRFAIIVALLGGIACALIASYFSFSDLSQPAPHHAQLQALLTGNSTDSRLSANSSATPVADAEKPSASPAEVEFTSKQATPLADLGAEFEKKNDRDVLPPNRIAPDMFSFATLPYDAPVAEFPLVLVGQRNLEWYITPKEPELGGIGGVYDSRSSIAGRPPGPPPGTPPSGGGPGGPPGGPSKPPPEVSNSGL